MSEQACPFCKGKGTVTHAYADAAERFDVNLVCEACLGTGDHDLMRLWRAFRLGQSHEHAAVMAQLGSGQRPPSMGAEAIRRAVATDSQWRRYDDALFARPVEFAEVVPS